MINKNIILLLHDIRSAYNVGSIIRTADGFGVNKIIFSGYTPYPELHNDTRLPHIKKRLTQQINKTSLGATENLEFELSTDVLKTIQTYKSLNFQIIAVEQDDKSVPLTAAKFTKKSLLVLGNETQGISKQIISKSDQIIEITMYGKKESFNVATAAAVVLYALRET